MNFGGAKLRILTAALVLMLLFSFCACQTKGGDADDDGKSAVKPGGGVKIDVGEPEKKPDFSFLRFQRLPGDLIIHFIDVGQGESIFIEFPDGKNMLMDGGSLITAPTSTIIDYLNRLGIKSGDIDYLLLTHPDRDHCNALDSILKRYTFDYIYAPYLTLEQVGSSSYEKFLEEAEEQKTAEIIHNIGVLSLDGECYDMTLYCRPEEFYLAMSEEDDELHNEVSPISILEYAGRKIAFTGDAGFSTEEYFMTLTAPIDCDVLKVGHHGSKKSTSAAFLEFIAPEYAVISVGAIDFIHPQEELLTRLKNIDATVYRTDLNGYIALIVREDGEMFFSLQKPKP